MAESKKGHNCTTEGPTKKNVVVYRVGILGRLFGTPPQHLEHRSIEDSGTTLWKTTPTFGTPLHRAPAQQREHHPIEPPTRPRATPYMVRVLVQHLEHHPTEAQGLHHPWQAQASLTFLYERLGMRIGFSNAALAVLIRNAEYWFFQGSAYIE